MVPAQPQTSARRSSCLCGRSFPHLSFFLYFMHIIFYTLAQCEILSKEVAMVFTSQSNTSGRTVRQHFCKIET